MPRHARLPLIAALALALAGCPARPVPGGVGASTPAGKASPRPGAASSAAPALAIPAGALAAAIAGRPTRKVEAGVATTLRGEVKLLANNGAGIISDNGGGIVSNNGGAVLSNNGGGVVANDAGRFRVAQAAGKPAEAWLADAVVTVHDAAGALLTGPDGKPLAALTDRSGRYALAAELPPGNVVLRVRLWNGGELAAMRAAGAADASIDTATSLGAAYVLGNFVQGDQAVYDKLPAAEAAALRSSIEAGRGALSGAPTYDPPLLLAQTEQLRAQVPAVDAKLKDIKTLLIGVKELGDGRPATEIALPAPAAMIVDERDHLLLLDRTLGRIRDIGPDGRLSTLGDLLRGTRIKRNFLNARGLLAAPGGRLFALDGQYVYAVAPDGAVTTFAGSDATARGPLGGAATATALDLVAGAVAPDGTLYLLDDADDGPPARLVRVGADGLALEEAVPDALRGEAFTAVGLAPDGTLLLASPAGGMDRLLARSPAGAWSLRASWPAATRMAASLAVAADGTAYLSSWQDGRLTRVSPAGEATPVAGPGAPGEGAAIAAGAVAMAPGGTLYVSDRERGWIFARGADGAWKRIAGTAGQITRSGDLTAIALNGPFGIVPDDHDGFLFAENSGFAIKRFDGAAISTFAGSGRGTGGDGGPAIGAQLDAPGGIARRDGVTWVLDTGNWALRRIGADGRITTAAGRLGVDRDDPSMFHKLAPGQRIPADKALLIQAQYLAIGPDGLVYWSMADAGQIWRLATDGMVEHVAGLPSVSADRAVLAPQALGAPPEVEPARDARLFSPAGLAFGPDGDLFFSEVYACRIRRLSGLATAQPEIRPFAGLPVGEALAGGRPTMSYDAADELARPFRELRLIMPAALCFDRRGDLYVAALGTRPALASAELGGSLAELLPLVEPGVVRLRRDGKAAAIAGPAARVLADPAAEEALALPGAIAIDARGRLAIADTGTNLVHIVPLPDLAAP